MKKDPTKDEIRDIFKEKDSKRGDIIKNPTLWESVWNLGTFWHRGVLEYQDIRQWTKRLIEDSYNSNGNITDWLKNKTRFWYNIRLVLFSQERTLHITSYVVWLWRRMTRSPRNWTNIVTWNLRCRPLKCLTPRSGRFRSLTAKKMLHRKNIWDWWPDTNTGASVRSNPYTRDTVSG